MSFDTSMTQKRAGVILHQHIDVQVDEINDDPQSFDAGAGPFDSYEIYVKWNAKALGIQRNDTLTDESNDQATYRVVKAKVFPDGHGQVRAFVPVGT